MTPQSTSPWSPCSEKPVPILSANFSTTTSENPAVTNKSPRKKPLPSYISIVSLWSTKKTDRSTTKSTIFKKKPSSRKHSNPATSTIYEKEQPSTNSTTGSNKTSPSSISAVMEYETNPTISSLKASTVSLSKWTLNFWIKYWEKWKSLSN